MDKKARTAKIRKVMKEWKSGTLKSSTGEKVKSQRQAIAIALSEAGVSKGAKTDEYWDSYVLTLTEEEDPEEENACMGDSLPKD